MSRVFISYRREDSNDVTGRIYDRLVEYFSSSGVFRDIDGIPLGSDFRAAIEAAVSQAGVVLVIIGPTWTSCVDQDGRRRLDSTRDFVRLEVQVALETGVPVIPVTVGRAIMPDPDELPDGIKQLAFRNGLSVRSDPDFSADMERLALSLEQWIPRATSSNRPTVIQALSDLAIEHEVERIDREWAEEREKHMITVMHGQTLVDGVPTGGYPVRTKPTKGGAIAGGIFGAFFAVFFTLIFGCTVGPFLTAIFGGVTGVSFVVLVWVVITVLSIRAAIDGYSKAEAFDSAEAAYLLRRATSLGKAGKDR